MPLCQAEPKEKSHDIVVTFFFGGPEGIRTHDLTDANRTLSQLSYRPKYNAGLPARIIITHFFRFVKPLFHFSVDIFLKV